MPDKKSVVNLRTVAESVGLAPCSVSAVLNNSPASLAIPQHTKDRVFRAAAKLNYRPNLSARSLRTKRTHLIAVISDDFARESVAVAVAGMERRLSRRGYLLALSAVDSPPRWNSLSVRLNQRGIEGVIAVGLSLPEKLELPGALINLGCIDVREPLTALTREWLIELGECAAEAVLSRIEGKVQAGAFPQPVLRRTKLSPNAPQPYFALPGNPSEEQVRRSVQQP